MNIGSAGPFPAYRAPVTVSAKAADERFESETTKAREAETGQESAAPVTARLGKLVDVKA